MPPWPGQEVTSGGQAAVAVDDAAVGDQVAIGLLETGVRGAHGAARMPGDVDRIAAENGGRGSAQEIPGAVDVVVEVELPGGRRGRGAGRGGGWGPAGGEALRGSE